jgi:hypothetical protein
MRTVRRQVRRATRVTKWPLHTKLAFGAWVPVLIVGFALYTGPNRQSQAAPLRKSRPSSTPAVVPMPPITTNAGPGITTAQQKAQEQAFAKWIAAIPPKRSVVQSVAVEKFVTRRDKLILAQEQEALRALHPPRSAGG